jgi:Polyketide cyclase / dehydrase and lipid transport
MFEITVHHDIPVEPAAVWSTLADYRRDPEWRTGVVEMTPSPSGPVTAGTTTREVLRMGGRTWVNIGVVDAVVAERAVRWHTTEGADANGTRSVEPAGRGSRVTLNVTVRPRGTERLAAPILRRMLERNMRHDLVRLGELVLADEPQPVNRS